ncbi:DUF1902 domain-containing protein [Yoonia sp. R2331]|uniref:DUF1902 domain-containing protein n=1 Tax=Yoonia sp. R2331 TaxID=3237238 RepID=UPI0034E5B6B6
MSNLNFEVTAVWDNEAEVWISESNITGLHIEADTLEEFESEVRAHATDLIVENHIAKADLASKPLRELIPTVFWRQASSGPATS